MVEIIPELGEVQNVRLLNQPWPTTPLRFINIPATTAASLPPPIIMAPQGYSWSIILYRMQWIATSTVGTRAVNLRVRDMSQQLFSATGAPGTNIVGTVYGETSEVGPVASQVGLIAGFPGAGPGVSTGASAAETGVASAPQAVTAAVYNVAFGGAIAVQGQLGFCAVDRSAIDTADQVRWNVIVAEQRLALRGGLQ